MFTSGWSETYSIRVGTYKFIDLSRPELYDTSVDPGETDNLIAQRPAVAAVLRVQLTKAYENTSTLRRTELLSDLRLTRLLEALGYATSVLRSADRAEESPIDPKDRAEVIQLYMNANESAARRDILHAIELTRQALAKAEESPPLHRLLGSLLLNKRKPVGGGRC